MRCHLFSSRFDGPAATLISRARAPFISSYACSSYNSSRPCSKRSSYLEAPTRYFSFRWFMVCLLVESIPTISVSERSLKDIFNFPDNIKLLIFLAINSNGCWWMKNFDNNTMEHVCGWLSFTYSSIKRVHSSTYSLLAFPESSINKFLFSFMASSYVEQTTCCRTMMENFSQFLISVDVCLAILWIVILLVFSFGLHSLDVELNLWNF